MTTAAVAANGVRATTKLRELLKAPGIVQAGGCGDALVARLVEAVGYPAIHLSGAYMNMLHGYPDGTLTLTEVAARVNQVADRVSIPVIVDADDGFGKIKRTVHEFERAGAAGLHIEDSMIKKRGHPMPIPDMVANLKVALDARSDPDFVIIARTDAVAPWRPPLEGDPAARENDAFERSVAYAEAGADVIMPLTASMDWVKRFSKQIPKPLLVITPELTVKELAPYNVKIVLYPTQSLARSFAVMKESYTAFLAAGKGETTEQDRKARAEIEAVLADRK